MCTEGLSKRSSKHFVHSPALGAIACPTLRAVSANFRAKMKFLDQRRYSTDGSVNMLFDITMNVDKYKYVIPEQFTEKAGSL